MSRILLLFENKENCKLLAEALGRRHEVKLPAATTEEGADLIIVDGPALKKHADFLRNQKHAADPVLLPVLLVISRDAVGVFSGPYVSVFDEVVLKPVEKVELFARVEMLLRARRLSLELNLRKDDLEAFIHAMTHDLRAPLRTVSGFAEAIADEQSTKLDAAGRHQLERIQAAVRQMWELIESLVEFSRIGRKALKLTNIGLEVAVRQAMDQMRQEIENSGADVKVREALGEVQADATLLRVAVCNLLSNAIKYVDKSVKPCVEIFSQRERGSVKLSFRDNGIGIAPEDQQRIFNPFIRLHGVEDYAGVGLGLAATRKVVELMGGQTGVISAPGQGSTFWIELMAGETQ